MQKHNDILSQLPELSTPFWLRGGNVQTLYAKLLQSPPPTYRRELLPDSTGTEQVAYDFIDAENANAPLVVLFHGLEGSSMSHYAIELMIAVKARGWNGVVAHFRGCGGTESTKHYHNGDSVEIEHMLNTLSTHYSTIYAVGASLGGNALAKYLGEQGRLDNTPIPHASAVVSSPIDALAAAKTLDKGLPRLIYTPYFFKSLLKKTPYPPTKKLRSLPDFDEMYTAPFNGFDSKEDYYQKTAAKPYLADINSPTLLLNAKNDPFMPAQFLPSGNNVSPLVYLLQPDDGGHIGFISGSGRGNLRWLPETVLRFFELVDVNY